MTEMITTNQNEIGKTMESLLIEGDLSKLTPEQRVVYYKKTCESLGLNPLTRPFEYQRFNGKVVLYARKEATEQLRSIHNVSIYKMEKETIDGVYVVTSYARTAAGKEDVSTGAVSITGLKGDNLSNAFMKAETKSKRRVTLSICGLGCLDETEVDTIPGSKSVKVDHETGEIVGELKVIEPDILPSPSLESLMESIKNAMSYDELKHAYTIAYKVHAGNLSLMTGITEAKDKRKLELEEIRDFQREMTDSKEDVA